jgi:hypothetical protein
MGVNGLHMVPDSAYHLPMALANPSFSVMGVLRDV